MTKNVGEHVYLVFWMNDILNDLYLNRYVEYNGQIERPFPDLRFKTKISATSFSAAGVIYSIHAVHTRVKLNWFNVICLAEIFIKNMSVWTEPVYSTTRSFMYLLVVQYAGVPELFDGLVYPPDDVSKYTITHHNDVRVL